ncbi:MAG: radical SAM protein [Magnetococcales bacterium]|nr:radical SAM protein [Magnetococcales bacterium]MBF0321335.1 radical SAM protein [Magnetococcales bacterium]
MHKNGNPSLEGMAGMSEKMFLFVNLAIDGGYQGVHHGIASLVPVVRQFGFAVRAMNLTSHLSTEDFLARVADIAPDVVGYSLTSLQQGYLQKFSMALRQHYPNLLQLAGGSGATLQPDMPGTGVDGFCLGEGETPLFQLLTTLASGGERLSVDGFHWHGPEGILRRPPTHFARDLDAFSFPDYSVFDLETVVFGSDASLSLILSRGCPYQCTFCSNTALRSVYDTTRGYFRTPSVQHALAAIRHQLTCYPQVRFIHFEDDLLIARKSWFIDFAERYRLEIGLPYRMNVRTECISLEIVTALRESGCVMAFLGVESGNETYRRTMLKRNHTNRQILERSALIKQANIKLFTFNIMGFPHESTEQMRDTLELNRQIGPDTGVCTFFYPFPGTELYDLCQREGLLPPEQDTPSQPTNYNTLPIIPGTLREKRACVRMVQSLRQYLYFQDLKHKMRLYRQTHSRASSVFYFLRLFAFFLARTHIPQNTQRRLYSLFLQSQTLAPVTRRILQGIK